MSLRMFMFIGFLWKMLLLCWRTLGFSGVQDEFWCSWCIVLVFNEERQCFVDIMLVELGVLGILELRFLENTGVIGVLLKSTGVYSYFCWCISVFYWCLMENASVLLTYSGVCVQGNLDLRSFLLFIDRSMKPVRVQWCFDGECWCLLVFVRRAAQLNYK